MIMKSKPDIGVSPLCLMCLTSDHSLTELVSQVTSLQRSSIAASLTARPLLEWNSAELGGIVRTTNPQKGDGDSELLLRCCPSPSENRAAIARSASVKSASPLPAYERSKAPSAVGGSWALKDLMLACSRAHCSLPGVNTLVTMTCAICGV